MFNTPISTFIWLYSSNCGETRVLVEIRWNDQSDFVPSIISVRVFSFHLCQRFCICGIWYPDYFFMKLSSWIICFFIIFWQRVPIFLSLDLLKLAWQTAIFYIVVGTFYLSLGGNEILSLGGNEIPLSAWNLSACIL